jgi:hypothetical protein
MFLRNDNELLLDYIELHSRGVFIFTAVRTSDPKWISFNPHMKKWGLMYSVGSTEDKNANYTIKALSTYRNIKT